MSGPNPKVDHEMRFLYGLLVLLGLLASFIVIKLFTLIPEAFLVIGGLVAFVYLAGWIVEELHAH